VSASPRRDGNSQLLAESVVAGARAAGHDALGVNVNDTIAGLLRDCRRCRQPDGNCSIDDGYRDLMLDHVLPADALVYATPLYWYGMAAALKNFFDRMVCYVSASYPNSNDIVGALEGKRIALVVASEESYPTASAAVVAQVQEMSRYLHQQFVAVVTGVGNQRGEVRFDPSNPLDDSYELGAHIFETHHSDYTITSIRHNTVWCRPPDTPGPREPTPD